MAIGTYVLAGAALTKEYFDYKKSEADLERAEKKRKEGLILSPEEKKALQRMRTRAQTPIPEGRLFSQGARQITNVANQQKQQYMQQATPYMEGSVVAKSVADTIDVKTRENLVDLADKIAIANAKARPQAESQLTSAEMQIGKAKRDFVEHWDEKAYQAKWEAWGEGLDLAFTAVDVGLDAYTTSQLSGKMGEYAMATSVEDKTRLLTEMMPYWDNIDTNQMMQIIAYMQANPQQFQ